MRFFLLPALPKWWGCLLVLAAALAGPSARAQSYYLDFNQQPIAVPGRLIWVEQVVDGRPGSPTNIGIIYKGMANKPSPVLFRRSLEADLTEWLGQQLPARPTDQAAVLCVRQLLVGETTTSGLLGENAVSSTQLAGDVYVHRPDGYHFVRSVAARSTKPGVAIDVNHAIHVAQLLQQCLGALSAADLTAAAQRPARTLAQVMAMPAPVARPAVLRAGAPRRGVYFSFEQFVANQPDTAVQLRLDTLRWSAVRANLLDGNTPRQIITPYGTAGYSRPMLNSPSGWKGTVQLKGKVQTADGGRVPNRTVWGFSDGQQAYVRQENVFRLLMRQNDFFTFVGAAPIDIRGAEQRPRMPAGGGARIDPHDSSGEPMVFALSLRTGQFSQFPPPGQPQRADTAFIYVYRPLGGPAEAQLLLFNDKVVAQLRPGESVELPWAHLGQAVRLGTAGSAALVLVPSTSAANYVRLQPGTGLATWRVLPAALGEAEVDALEQRH